MYMLIIYNFLKCNCYFQELIINNTPEAFREHEEHSLGHELHGMESMTVSNNPNVKSVTHSYI